MTRPVKPLKGDRQGPALWDHLGPIGTRQPFVPFEEQYKVLNVIKVPWPGRSKKTGRPYPRVWGLCCGRRFGKTTLGEVLVWMGLTAPNDSKGPPTVRVTADTEEHGMKIWRPFIWHLENTDLVALKKDYSREYQRVELISGATAQLFSANNPAALSGDGVSLWLIDEAQFLSQDAWTNLFPSISDRSGIIVMLGVAQGEGPFREVCYRGDDKEQPEFRHVELPTSANPYISKWDIEFAKRTLTDKEFEQLYLARWVSELGKVFWGVEGCVSHEAVLVDDRGFAYTHRPVAGSSYYGGLDLARLQDWLVYTIWDRHGRLVAWDRFKGLSWDAQYARCAAFSAAYNHPITVVDSTGLGDPAFDALAARGMNVTEYKISSNEKKRSLVDKLAIRIGQGEVRYPRIREFITELNRMEAKRKEGSSVIQYEAPSGASDDFVLSAALAFQMIPEPSQLVEQAVFGDVLQSGEEYRQIATYEYIT